ncbi:ComEC/Rec2 family competence protein [soil metagenome]
MGGWLVVVAAGGLWAGVLGAGLIDGALTVGRAAGVLLGGGLALGLAAAPAVRARMATLTLCLAVLLGFALIGGGWSGLREARVRGSPFVSLSGQFATVEGTVSSDPTESPFGWTATLDARVLGDDREGGRPILHVRDALWVQGDGSLPRFETGDRVAIEGLVRPLEDSFGVYLLHRGYAAILDVSRFEVLGPPTNPLVRLADMVRSALRSSVRAVLPPKEAGLLLGLALGDTSSADPEVTEDFRATGLSHLTAVSGANVAMFLAPVMGLAVLLGLGRRARLGVGVSALAFFVLLTRAEPSVLRAGVMAGLAMLGLFLGRPRSPPALIGGAVLLLLGIDPTLVYSIGFQLSVAATGGILLLAGPLSARLRLLPEGIALAAGVTLGAQAGVTPLLLYHFGVVPSVTLPANLLAFPAVGAAMLLGLGAATLGLLIGPLGLLIVPLGIAVAAAARLPLAYLITLADRLARSPFPSVTSPGGSLFELAFGLAAVGALAWWIRSRPRFPRAAGLLAGLILPLFVWSAALRAGPPETVVVTFFDVGQGDAALVRSPGGASILIDAGPEPDEVATKLAALGIRRLDLAVATHPHADHVAGFPAVLARFPVALLIEPRCGGDSPFHEALVRSIRANAVPVRHPVRGSTLLVGDVRVEVLAPDRCYTGTDSDANNDSLVLRIVYRGSALLFTGDVEDPAQADLLEQEPDRLRATVLKVPHHGGDTSLDEFFPAVGARVALVSVGVNLYGHPVPEVLAELREAGMVVLRTDRLGDVTVALRGQEVSIESERG